jgi:hypothetical protein
MYREPLLQQVFDLISTHSVPVHSLTFATLVLVHLFLIHNNSVRLA